MSLDGGRAVCPRCGEREKGLRLARVDWRSRAWFAVTVTLVLLGTDVFLAWLNPRHFARHREEQLLAMGAAVVVRLLLVYFVAWPVALHRQHAKAVTWAEHVVLATIVPVLVSAKLWALWALTSLPLHP